VPAAGNVTLYVATRVSLVGFPPPTVGEIDMYWTPSGAVVELNADPNVPDSASTITGSVWASSIVGDKIESVDAMMNSCRRFM
jgi:hypothetical protein